MSLPLWFLDRPEEDKTWEECHAQVVAAPDEITARDLAADNAYGEGRAAWYDKATCTQIAPTSVFEVAKVVLSKEAS